MDEQPTLRDFFAAAALIGLIIQPDKRPNTYMNDLTVFAYRLADDMMDKREKK